MKEDLILKNVIAEKFVWMEKKISSEFSNKNLFEILAEDDIEFNSF